MIRQFDVCVLKAARAGGRERRVVILQHDLLSDMRTRLVAPLLASSEVDHVDRLTPKVEFGGAIYMVGMHQIVTVELSSLGPRLGTVDARDGVMRAVDLIFVGF